MAPGAEFCPECGNSRDGIQCPDCGNLSIFDFCTKCGKPLTEGAKMALEQAKNDPDAKAMVEAVQQAAGIEEELAKLNAIIAAEPVTAPPRVKKERFSDAQMAAILKTEQNMDAAALRRAEDEKKMAETAKKDAEAKKLAAIQEAIAKKNALEKQQADAFAAAEAALMKFKNKTFISHQEARRFHNAIKPCGDDVSGWLCNFTNTVHSDGPNGCDEPGHGGYWYKGATIAVDIKGPC
jgi:membrane protein involved in colicin uptake